MNDEIKKENIAKYMGEMIDFIGDLMQEYTPDEVKEFIEIGMEFKKRKDDKKCL